jgi:mannose-6-phosphate isomerase-like protein (cupin superfamily)
MSNDELPTKFPHLVIKPWGKEVWLELNESYCFKELYLNPGQRTSFQYHEHKIETLYVLEGELWTLLENESRELKEVLLKPGESLTVLPFKKHRMFTKDKPAKYLEASTPEVHDVIRIEDDSGRESGKIDSEHNKN